MSRIRSVGSTPEVLVRSVAHRLGYRFRKNVRLLPGKPDMVLKKYGAVVFVHGCFWHQHRGCNRCNIPKSNQEYWIPKLQGNIERDAAHEKQLKELGWRVLVIWECETKDAALIINKLSGFLSGSL